MNTLANHGFLPHDGRNITYDILAKALKDGMNIGAEVALEGFTRGLPSNPTPNATWLNLDMLNKHNVIEHDGSLSRRDSVFDPTNRFDKGTFNSFLKYFGNAKNMTIASTANARARHALDMSLVNPTFSITTEQVPVICGENAMMLAVWGHPELPIANREYYEYFFRTERLPVELGWSPSTVEIGPTVAQIVQDLMEQSPKDVPLTFSPQPAK
ncbi:Chloroperoxidase [Bisporella sp. PMI_857]|nr:Chloroperoxidase [Bisporella sp. PMI_857]